MRDYATLAIPEYTIDLDPTHQVLRVTHGEVVTDQIALDGYRALGRLAAQGGPYALITDCSEVKELKLSADTARYLALAPPAVPAGRPRIVVVNRVLMYGLTRMIASTRTAMGLQFYIVWSVDEAYAMLGISPEDFSRRLIPEDTVAAGSVREYP